MKIKMIPDLRHVQLVIIISIIVYLPCLQWLENTFLKYIKDWEAYVQSKNEIPKAEKQFCTLPKQTTSGLSISGKTLYT